MIRHVKAVGVLALLLGAMGCSGKSDQHHDLSAKSPVSITVASVERSATAEREELMGTVVPRNRADIQSKVQAKVERIGVTLGSVVDAGQMLAELDSRELAARVRQGRAVSRQAAVDLVRYDSLLSRKLVSQQEYDAVKTKADIAAGSLAEAEAMLSYTRIEAPFAGRVTQKTVDIGDLAVPGKPLFVIEESAAPRFEVNIPESRRGLIALGDTLPITLDPAAMQITGTVVEISPSADAATRSYLAKLEIPIASGARGGQFGRLLLPTLAQSGLLIPSQSLVKRGQLEIVFVISADHHAETRLVRSGRTVGNQVEILSGLTEGELVAVTGSSLLSSGDPVEITK